MRTCCRAHWAADSGFESVRVGYALLNPVGMPFIVCSVCGNKRCPRATDCALPCTGSNEPGQPGSVYEGII